MASSNFIDYVKIYCSSGKGGAGSRHLRREKFAPKGGPDGGDGGRGGHIYLHGKSDMWTLLHLKYQRHFRAKHGESGGSARKSGADGEDVTIFVPLGTVVKDKETEEVLLEITDNEQVEILLKGGLGGLGNTHFKTSVNQTPRYAQPGQDMLEGEFILELKVLADVGLVGFPNAGKSTLLSVLSAAKPKIADYPFTTLQPNLGIVQYRDSKSFIIADIPGIIEGAAEGKGLGLRFLRHIERNSALMFVVPAESDDINKEYKILLAELKKYNPELLDKQRVLVISKSDLLDEELTEMIMSTVDVNIPYILVSAVAQKGLAELKDLLWKTINTKID
ncbi:MAG: GTPase ObgE [Bacteroidota bacterium]|nr:GTPase ObgE [Bacteroidota bacterium]